MTNMRVKFNVAEFDAFQFNRHTFEELPGWARSYSVPHGPTRAQLYRHSVQPCVYVPVRGGYLPCSQSDWLIHDGEQILVVPDAEFKRRYKVIQDEMVAPPFITEDNAGGDPF